MNVKYIEFNGKHPKNSKQYRKYTDKPSSTWLSYGCSYDSAFLKVDIDDFDRKTGALEDSVKGKPRSEAIVEILDKLGVKYNGIQTEHGKHLFFRKPAALEEGNKQNWHTPIGIKAEWKFPGRDDHIPLVINGVKRQFFKGSLTNMDVDELPFYLYPLQKSKDKPFNLSISSGNRTNGFGAYLFHLINKGFTADEAAQIVRLMNDYVLEEPISYNELYATTLNDSTMEKLKDRQREKELTEDIVADEIIEQYKLIRVKGSFYSYDGGVYKPFDDQIIRKYISETYPKKKINFEREVIRHVESRSYTEKPEDTGIVNVKNGLLLFDEKGNVTPIPHTREHISFKQFNASYRPEISSTFLDNTINQWFSGSAEQVELFDQMLGYLLMNHTRYQKSFFFIGQPATGKSTALGMIKNFCGSENVSDLPLNSFTDKQSLDTLVNKIANIDTDLNKKKIHEAGTFKKLVVGEEVHINPKYIKPYFYRFTGKLLFGMNELPDYSSDDKGVDRRVAFFTFDRVFKEGSKDRNNELEIELKTEEIMSALLNHAIKGYKSLVQNGHFIKTKESGKMLTEFIAMNNNIEQWINEADLDEEYFIREPINYDLKGSYPEYKAFCFNIGVEPKEQQGFSRYISQKYNLKTYLKREGNERIRRFRKIT